MAITINVNLDEILAALKDDLDFTGNADKYIKVNATADGFEFAAVDTSGLVPYTGATTNVNLGEFGVNSGYLQFDLTPTNTPTSQGTAYWDDSAETVALIMNGTTQKVGEDTFYHVKNSTGVEIAKGTAVMFAGTDGASGKLLITPFLADGTYPSSYFMGITAEAIANGANGKVYHFGKMRSIDTSVYNDGDILYASTTSAGGFQTTKPSAPNNVISVAAVVNAGNNGTLMIRPIIEDSPTLDDVTTAGNTTTNSISVGGLAVDTDTLFVDATNNRVGIGTATPTYTFHASGTTSDSVSPISFVENLGNSLYVPTQVLHAPNITNNRNVYFSIGKSASTRNRINWLYYHNSDGSTSNRMDFTFFGVNTLFHILADGSFGMNTLSPTATLHVLSNSVSKVGAIIQAAAGQTANLQEWKDSAGNVLASIGSAGKLSIGATGGLRYTPSATRYTDYTGLNLGGGIYLSFTTTSQDSFVSYVGGAASSNIYMYWNSAGNINTRGSILLGAADGAATLAGAASSAQLEVRSTTKGFLPPRMTGAQVEAISSPAEGLIAYATNAGAGDVTAKGLYIYNGTNWVSL